MTSSLGLEDELIRKDGGFTGSGCVLLTELIGLCFIVLYSMQLATRLKRQLSNVPCFLHVAYYNQEDAIEMTWCAIKASVIESLVFWDIYSGEAS